LDDEIDEGLFVEVEVQVDAWFMLFTGCLVQVDWYRFTVVYLTVIV
jgi:hypothetical protein